MLLPLPLWVGCREVTSLTRASQIAGRKNNEAAHLKFKLQPAAASVCRGLCRHSLGNSTFARHQSAPTRDDLGSVLRLRCVHFIRGNEIMYMYVVESMRVRYVSDHRRIHDARPLSALGVDAE